MSVLGHVFDSLAGMSLLQLLLAFMACMGYATAQGGLLAPRGRQLAGATALAAAGAFTLLSTDWTAAIMLVAFAVAGLGLFVSAAWVLSRSVLAAGSPAASDAAFATGEAEAETETETETETEAEADTEADTDADRELDLSRPADSGFMPPRVRRRRVQSA